MKSRPPNNFDAVRILSAIAVLVGHAFVLTGNGPAPTLFAIPLHTIAVAVFFSISGYLIAGSWERVPVWDRFLWHRCLRIFPGLIALVLVTVFIVGPLISSLSILEYFANSETYKYLQSASTLATYSLPGVFGSEIHAVSAVNGSLWTLGVELICYFFVLGVGFFVRSRRGAVYLALAMIGTVITFFRSSRKAFWCHLKTVLLSRFTSSLLHSSVCLSTRASYG